MGRKSNKKKIIRENLKGKDEKVVKISKKIKSKISLPKINYKPLLGGILSLLMIIILLFVGYFLFEKAFRAKPLAKILPSKNTIAFVEFNTNFDHNQLIKTFKLLEKYPQYSKENLIKFIEKKLSGSYETDLKPWLGRQSAIALINSKSDKYKLYTLYFLESFNEANLQIYLEKIKPLITSYKKNKIYNKNNEFFTEINSYLVFSENIDALTELIDLQKDQKLYRSSKYRKVDDNLPINKVAFAYLDFNNINDGFIKSIPFLSEKGISMETIKPFINLFDSEGVALIAMDNNMAVQSFLNFKEPFSESTYYKIQNKYNANLANFVPKDVLMFYGGIDLEKQLNRIVDIFSKGESSTINIFNNIVQNYTQKYFGPQVSLKNDILPLLHNEFAFVIENNKGKGVYKFLIELSNAQKDALVIQELANNFASEGAIFEPKIIEHKLPDGTNSKEIVAFPEEIIRNESNYKETLVHELKMGKQNWSIYYAISNNKAIVSNSLDSLKKSIDLTNNKGISFKATDTYNKEIASVIKSSDEISYFNFKDLIPLEKLKLPEFLKIISSLSAGQNYFDDGIVSINYLQLK